MDHEKRRAGRPRGKPYPVLKQIRLSEADAGRLARLAARREKPEAWIMREAIRELAEKEGLA